MPMIKAKNLIFHNTEQMSSTDLHKLATNDEIYSFFYILNIKLTIIDHILRMENSVVLT